MRRATGCVFWPSGCSFEGDDHLHGFLHRAIRGVFLHKDILAQCRFVRRDLFSGIASTAASDERFWYAPWRSSGMCWDRNGCDRTYTIRYLSAHESVRPCSRETQLCAGRHCARLRSFWDSLVRENSSHCLVSDRETRLDARCERGSLV